MFFFLSSRLLLPSRENPTIYDEVSDIILHIEIAECINFAMVLEKIASKFVFFLLKLSSGTLQRYLCESYKGMLGTLVSYTINFSLGK